MPLSFLVASDTHGRADLLLEAFERAKPDGVFFLGDGLRDLNVLPEDTTLRAVRGNCDWTAHTDAPNVRVEEVGGYRIYLTHGHAQGVKLSLDTAIVSAATAGANVLLHGHTHVPFEKTYPIGTKIGGTVLQKPLLVVCPGSLGQPPDGVPSFATLTLAAGGVLAGFGKL
ncbi:MAG: metallophosphoesterase family protein [Ruminococcaceae bacterium]|nr:metallophosphoesterase family protein [Oscillospiraceae bacterium]